MFDRHLKEFVFFSSCSLNPYIMICFIILNISDKACKKCALVIFTWLSFLSFLGINFLDKSYCIIKLSTNFLSINLRTELNVNRHDTPFGFPSVKRNKYITWK